jgi:hypothetical protein
VLWQDTNVSKIHAASIFRVNTTRRRNPEQLDLEHHRREILRNLKVNEVVIAKWKVLLQIPEQFLTISVSEDKCSKQKKFTFIQQH